MVTINKRFKKMGKKEVLEISDKFLHGWTNLAKTQHCKLSTLNRARSKFNLPKITKSNANAYRVHYIQTHYTQKEIQDELEHYLNTHLVDSARWHGIVLFDCRFYGSEFVKLFRKILTPHIFNQISEKTRLAKLMKTQIQNGGIGVSNIKACNKMLKTKLDKKQNILNNTKLYDVRLVRAFDSRYEYYVYIQLCQFFGRSNVKCQYKSDKYPFYCDFYISSIDTYIELNYHFSHVGHWFENSKSDKALVAYWHKIYSDYYFDKTYKTWCVSDVQKRKCARINKLNYLVFWHGYADDSSKNLIPRLVDVDTWLIKYQGNVSEFLKNHPENTY